MSDLPELLTSLAGAQSHPDGVVSLAGDWGGHVYVVCSAHVVDCTESALEQLLLDLNEIAWPDDAKGSTDLMYLRLKTWQEAFADSRGIDFNGLLWMDKLFVELELEQDIIAVLHGELERVRHSHETVYVIVRLYSGAVGDQSLTVKLLKIFSTLQEAKLEVERLNRSRSGDNFRYIWKSAWLPREWPQAKD